MALFIMEASRLGNRRGGCRDALLLHSVWFRGSSSGRSSGSGLPAVEHICRLCLWIKDELLTIA